MQWQDSLHIVISHILEIEIVLIAKMNVTLLAARHVSKRELIALYKQEENN